MFLHKASLKFNYNCIKDEKKSTAHLKQAFLRRNIDTLLATHFKPMQFF